MLCFAGRRITFGQLCIYSKADRKGVASTEKSDHEKDIPLRGTNRLRTWSCGRQTRAGESTVSGKHVTIRGRPSQTQQGGGAFWREFRRGGGEVRQDSRSTPREGEPADVTEAKPEM